MLGEEAGDGETDAREGAELVVDDRVWTEYPLRLEVRGELVVENGISVCRIAVVWVLWEENVDGVGRGDCKLGITRPGQGMRVERALLECQSFQTANLRLELAGYPTDQCELILLT